MSTTDDRTNEASAAVRQLLERGIAQVKAGEHDPGMAAFEDAGRQAAEAGLTDLAAGAAIDRGWALWLAGDRERSVAAYEEGAVLAREAKDEKRLAIALGNLGIAYTDAHRYEDADALYEEYLPLVADDRDEQVGAQLNRGIAREGLGRMDEALELYWKAFDVASEADDPGLVGAVTMTLGRAYTRAGDHAKAADCFGEAARAYRYLEDPSLLGSALYLHGMALQRVGLLDQALEVWREAEPVFREIGDNAALGECLLAQALALRDQRSNLGADLQFAEAAVAFREAGMVDRLPEIHLVHAQWCWDRSLDAAARTHVQEALDALVASPNPQVESRARALNAQVLAEAHEVAQAEAELEAAEAVARAAGDAEAVTGALVRRAYVMARGGASWEDVRAQLFAAGDHAREAGHEAAGRYAAEAIADEIAERCGRAFTDLLGVEDEKSVVAPSGDEGV